MSTCHCFPIYLATVWLGRYNDSVNFPPLYYTPLHTLTHSHSLYQFAFVSISVCCADGSTNSVSLVRSSRLLSHCQVKSLNLQGTTTAVLCCVPTLTHSRLLSHDQLPQRALNRYNHNPSFYLCCVCACVCVVLQLLSHYPVFRLGRYNDSSNLCRVKVCWGCDFQLLSHIQLSR